MGEHGHKPEQYGDHTLLGVSNANEARLGARSREAEGRTEAEQPPAPRPPLADPVPTTPPKGRRQTPPPPPPPSTPQAPDRPGRTGPPTRGGATQSQAREGRDRATPHPPS